MGAILRPRRGTKAVADSKNFVLAKGEIFFEVPSGGVGKGLGRIKMGDGSTAYKNLPYFQELDLIAATGLDSTSKSTIRTNIGAGTSNLALGSSSSTAYRGDRGTTAYNHSQATHARTDATAVAASSTNGNIKINGTETTVYTHPGSGTNPHGTTKSDVGLGNVGNFKAVSTVASQGLSDTEKSNARANIGAGTSSLALGTTSSTAYRGDYGNTAYTHSQSTHARTDATCVAASTTNGKIKINGTETTVYTHPGNGTNPHGTTKSDVGLGNVGNFKAVSTVASQGLSNTEKSNARTNIAAASAADVTQLNNDWNTFNSSIKPYLGCTSCTATDISNNINNLASGYRISISSSTGISNLPTTDFIGTIYCLPLPAIQANNNMQIAVSYMGNLIYTRVYYNNATWSIWQSDRKDIDQLNDDLAAYENYCRYGKVLTNELASYITIPSSASSYVSQIVNYWCIGKKTDGTLNFHITIANGSTGIPITNDYEILEINIWSLIGNEFPWIQNSGAWNLHVKSTPDIYTYGNSSTDGTSYMRGAVVPCYLYPIDSPQVFRVRADFLGGIYSSDALVDQTHLKALSLVINAPIY